MNAKTSPKKILSQPYIYLHTGLQKPLNQTPHNIPDLFWFSMNPTWLCPNVMTLHIVTTGMQGCRSAWMPERCFIVPINPGWLFNHQFQSNQCADQFFKNQFQPHKCCKRSVWSLNAAASSHRISEGRNLSIPGPRHLRTCLFSCPSPGRTTKALPPTRSRCTARCKRGQQQQRWVEWKRAR